MKPHHERWEQGSEFHWPSFEPPQHPAWYPGSSGTILCGSGRDAFRLLLTYGQRKRGWRRLWVPSYYCQEVVSALASDGMDIQLYPDSPEDATPGLEGLSFLRGDVLLVVNFFGLRASFDLTTIVHSAVEVIEDHSHDPWSAWATGSEADFCVVSLRKTLPLPDGGVLWSPRGHSLPSQPPVSIERKMASHQKLSAMLLKALYLKGHAVEKELYRELQIAGEQGIASGPVSGMLDTTVALLSIFPVNAWRVARQVNHRQLIEKLFGIPWVRVLKPRVDDACPFTAILVFDCQKRRDHVRRRLIENRIYPAILWPLEEAVLPGIPSAHVDLSRRVLSIRCDMRYDASDIDLVADAIIQAGQDCRV